MALDKHAKLNPPPPASVGRDQSSKLCPTVEFLILGLGTGYWAIPSASSASSLNTRDEKGIMLLGLIETFFWRPVCEVALGLFE